MKFWHLHEHVLSVKLAHNVTNIWVERYSVHCMCHILNTTRDPYPHLYNQFLFIILTNSSLSMINRYQNASSLSRVLREKCLKRNAICYTSKNKTMKTTFVSNFTAPNLDVAVTYFRENFVSQITFCLAADKPNHWVTSFFACCDYMYLKTMFFTFSHSLIFECDSILSATFSAPLFRCPVN